MAIDIINDTMKAMTTNKKLNPLVGIPTVGVPLIALAAFAPYALVFLTMLSFIVFIHEAGHYATGRALNVTVKQFSVGFGPILTETMHNDISYSLRVIPLGGFVEFDESSMKDSNSWKEILISLAGPAVNFAAPIIALSTVMLLKGNSPLESLITSSETIWNIVTDFFSTLNTFGSNTLNVFKELFGIETNSESIITTAKGGEIIKAQSETNGTFGYLIVFCVLSTIIGAVNLLPFGPLDGYNVLAKSIDMVVRNAFTKPDFSFKNSLISRIYLTAGVAFLLILQAAVVALEVRQMPTVWIVAVAGFSSFIYVSNRMFGGKPFIAAGQTVTNS